MIVASSWFSALVVLQTVTSIKEFTYVATHILLQNELTARVVVHVIPYVDDHLIKDHKFLAEFYSVLKVVLRVVSLFLYLPFDFTS